MVFTKQENVKKGTSALLAYLLRVYIHQKVIYVYKNYQNVHNISSLIPILKSYFIHKQGLFTIGNLSVQTPF